MKTTAEKREWYRKEAESLLAHSYKPLQVIARNNLDLLDDFAALEAENASARAALKKMSRRPRLESC